LDYFVLVLFAFVVFGSVSSVLCQEIGWEGCLLKLPILCPVGHKTFTQSISLTFGRHYCCGTVGKILGKPFGWYALLSSVQQQSVDGNSGQSRVISILLLCQQL